MWSSDERHSHVESHEEVRLGSSLSVTSDVHLQCERSWATTKVSQCTNSFYYVNVIIYAFQGRGEKGISKRMRRLQVMTTVL